MSMMTAERIRPLLAALAIGLCAPVFAGEESAQQASDESAQEAGETQQQASSDGQEKKQRPEGEATRQEAQKGQDSSLSHDIEEESLDQENSSDPMMQPDGYSGG